MHTVRQSADRGQANFGWLDSKHTFSFSSYYDPAHMGYRTLRVINEDKVSGGAGFPTHPHENMEIISYVISGSLAHKDSMGNVERIGPGEVQAMSAGTGLFHSEFNPEPEETVHFLQIWLVPDKMNHTPRYAQKHFDNESKRNQLRLIVSNDGAEESLPIHQDARVYASILEQDRELNYSLESGRGVWIQVINGDLQVNDQRLQSGDGLSIEDVKELSIAAEKETEFLLFDLA
jgi:redox-sensitive bicupin YhaK (pirin superfamily)